MGCFLPLRKGKKLKGGETAIAYHEAFHYRRTYCLGEGGINIEKKEVTYFEYD